MYLIVIGVLLLVLKFADFGPVGQWSWWIVLAPFAGAAIWWAWADASSTPRIFSLSASTWATAAAKSSCHSSVIVLTGVPGASKVIVAMPSAASS